MANPTIKQLREWSVDHALQIDLTTIGADRVDYAWRIVLEELLRLVPAIGRKVATLATVADAATIDLSTLPATWVRDRFVQAWVDTDYELQLRSERHVRQQRVLYAGTGRPAIVAILEGDDDTALLCPTPDAVYAVRWIYDQPLTIFDDGGDIASWTDGTDPTNAGNAATYTVNVDERWARMACYRGVPAVLTHGNKKAAFGERDWQAFIEWCQEQMATPDEPAIVEPDLI